MRDIAETWLDWANLGPRVEKYRALIADDVERDTDKLGTTAEFKSDTFGTGDGSAQDARSIKGFAAQRRDSLLQHPEVGKAQRPRR